jgi:diadenylate cyclase
MTETSAASAARRPPTTLRRPASILAAGLAWVAIAAPAAAAVEQPGLLETVKPVVEVAFFFVFFLAIFRFLSGTRGEGMLKGIATITFLGFMVLLKLARDLELARLELVLDSVFGTTVLVFVILFQPELRRGLLTLGANRLVRLFVKDEGNPIDAVVQAALRLAKNKVGALIAFEREVGLNNFADNGVRIDAALTPELIETIFFPGSALHDGAVIIQEKRIAAAGCLFPLTDNPSISKRLGTRHRAAIGLTEETDAVTLVVSEETGKISIGAGGELYRNLDAETLTRELKRLLLGGTQGDNATQALRAAAAEREGAGASSQTLSREALR